MQDRENLSDLPPLGEPDDDGRWPPFGEEQLAASKAAPSISAQPFAWIEPSQMPRRQWVLGRHLIRRFVSATVSPGGVGKSSLEIAEAISLATGRNLTGNQPHGTYRVWVWNGEDPREEIERRVVATCMHYGVTRAELGGRLFVNSGRETAIIVATQGKNGVEVNTAAVEALKATILRNRIDVVSVDPFISCHAVNENDNQAVNVVATVWAEIAEACNCAVSLVHHARKTGGNEVVMEDARGAGALLAKVRAGRVLNQMTKDEAERAGVPTRGVHFRVDRGKGNLSPPSTDASEWYRLASIDLGNGGDGNLDFGDSVGVVEPWKWPDPMESVSVADLRAAQAAISEGGPWRENSQAKEWAGRPIARAMRLNPDDRQDREKVKRMLKVWIANGMFVVVQGQNEKRRPTPMIEVGTLATD